MIAMYVSGGVALVAAGAAIGIVAMVCLGIKRDDRPGGFPATPMTGVARAARKMTGAGARRPERGAAAGRDQTGDSVNSSQTAQHWLLAVRLALVKVILVMFLLFWKRPPFDSATAAERANWPLPAAAAQDKELTPRDDDAGKSGGVGRPLRRSRRRRRLHRRYPLRRPLFRSRRRRRLGRRQRSQAT
jgi:hypothetical protein